MKANLVGIIFVNFSFFFFAKRIKDYTFSKNVKEPLEEKFFFTRYECVFDILSFAMWGIAAIAVVDRYGDPAFLKIFFHPSLTLRPPSFSSSAFANDSPSIGVDASPDKKNSSSSPISYFSVGPEDVLSIHLLLFAALDKSESILVEDVRKRMAAEGGMGRTAALRRNSGENGSAPKRWDELKSLDGIKKDPLKRIVDVDGFLLISPFSPAYRMEGTRSTSARRETVPFVEQHTKSMEGEKATYFAENGRTDGNLSLSSRTEWKRYRTSSSMNPSSSLFSHQSVAEIPSAISSSSPATPLSLDHPHSPRVVSPLEEAEDTPFMGTPRIQSSLCRASTDLHAWSPEGSTRRRRTRFSPLLTTHAASATEVATTCNASPTLWSAVRTSTSTSYFSSHSSSRSSSSTDEYSHSSSSSSSSSASSPHSFAISPSPSLHRDPHQWAKMEPTERTPSPATFPPDKLAATTKYSSEAPARTMPLSSSPSLHGPQPLPGERREETEKSTASCTNSRPLLWISASPSPSSFSSFPLPFPSHSSRAVSHTTEGSVASIAPPAEPQYLGKVEASSDERFQCYACCAGTGMRVFVVTVTRRRCRARLSSLHSISSLSSTSNGTLDEPHPSEVISFHHTIQEEATQNARGRTPGALSATEQRMKVSDACLSRSSSFSADSSLSEKKDEEAIDAPLHREGSSSLQEEEGSGPSDDAMILITRSILESASIASCNPLNSCMKASRLSSAYSPFPSTLEDEGPFFSREPLHFPSTTGLHSRRLPPFTSLKTVLLHSRSFQLQLERIIASLEFTS